MLLIEHFVPHNVHEEKAYRFPGKSRHWCHEDCLILHFCVWLEVGLCEHMFNERDKIPCGCSTLLHMIVADYLDELVWRDHS